MPLPDPPGGPASGKRRNPINASAFSFSLDSPAKKARPLNSFVAGSTPLRPTATRDAVTTPRTGLQARKVDPSTPNAAAGPSRLRDLPDPFTTPLPPPPSATVPPKRGLMSLPSPLGLLPAPSRTPAGPVPTSVRKLHTVIDDIASPFRAPTAPAQNLRKLGELPERDVQELEELRDKRREKLRYDEGGGEEGVGVSPRKAKVGKYMGKGPAALSVQLANLLSSGTSSLLLFYVDLQHTLFPPARTPRRPTSASASASSATTISNPEPRAPVPAIKHLRTAPLHLRVLSAVQGPTHAAEMFWCEIVARPGRAEDEKVGDGRVMLVLQAVPTGCPRLGVDPRTVKVRLGGDGEQAGWEIGVWGPWSEVKLPFAADQIRSGTLQGIREDMMRSGDEESGQDGGARVTRVIMAGRYLLGEAPKHGEAA